MITRDYGGEIWNELREDFCERLAVPAHQRIGRCVRWLDSTGDRALEHQLRTHAGLVDLRELHGWYRRERPGLHGRSVLTRRICKAWCSGREAQSAEQRTREATHTGKPPLDLTAPACAANTPFAEVLTIVRQDAIAAFAEAGTCPRQHLATIEAWPIMSNPDAAAVCEMFERNLFHRSAAQFMAGASVMNDVVIADVDAMVAVERARDDEMRAERGFLSNAEVRVACE